MKIAGAAILTLGIVGLLLALILWLPSGIDLAVLALISVVCFVSVWGGGRLLMVEAGDAGKGQANEDETVKQQPQRVQVAVFCTKCGWQGAARYRFCGSCGSALSYRCLACGAVVPSTSKFCTTCGSRLS